MKQVALLHRVKAERRGRLAESLAVLLMLAKGYVPVARRAKTPLGEIDLIVRRGKELVLVEVKRRATLEDGLGAVPPRQQKRIIDAFAWWLARNPRYVNCNIRCDVVAFAPRRFPRHIKNAFTA